MHPEECWDLRVVEKRSVNMFFERIERAGTSVVGSLSVVKDFESREASYSILVSKCLALRRARALDAADRDVVRVFGGPRLKLSERRHETDAVPALVPVKHADTVLDPAHLCGRHVLVLSPTTQRRAGGLCWTRLVGVVLRGKIFSGSRPGVHLPLAVAKVYDGGEIRVRPP